MADDAALARMLEHAARASNFTLAKAAFVEAHLRGLGGVIGRYFDEVDDEARELYQEMQEAPSEEMLERQVQSVEQIIQPAAPEQLAGTPSLNA